MRVQFFSTGYEWHWRTYDSDGTVLGESGAGCKSRDAAVERFEAQTGIVVAEKRPTFSFHPEGLE